MRGKIMAEQLKLNFVNYKKGSYIVVEGKENADHFFIIQQGKVKITKELEMVKENNILGPGDFFGVVSAMSSHSHIETAQAMEDVILVVVHRTQYSGLIQKNPQVAMKIIVQFSKRLRFLDESLSEHTLKKTVKAGESDFFAMGEYYIHQNQYKQAFHTYSKYLEYYPEGDKAAAAKDQLAKIGAKIKDIKTEFGPNEFNRSYPKESMFFAEGETGKELFIIQKGSVKIVRIVDNKEVLLAMLKAGDIFGEMALLEEKPRAAGAVAFEDCEVMVVNQDNFKLVITNQPPLVAKITTLLADRIWFIYKQLANTLLTNPLGRMYDAMLIHLEKNRAPVNDPTPHTFDFGPAELAHMAGLHREEGGILLEKMMENKKVRVENNKMHTTSMLEILRQTEYYRKMHQIEKARKENKTGAGVVA
jgi:CRP-like cAMP-binding protein